MHSRAGFLRSGLRLVCRQQQRLASVSRHIVKSPLPDVELPTLSVPEYVWQHVDQWPNKVAFECGVTGRHYRYAEARELCRRFAASLRRAGLQPGHTLVIVMPNTAEWPIILLGSVEAGIVVSTANPDCTADELSRQLRDCEPKAIVTLSTVLPKVQKAITLAARQVKPLTVIAPGIEPGSHIPTGTVDFREMIRDGIDTSDFRFTGNAEDTAVLPYSSGTTGFPKGVMLSHRNIVSNIAQHNDSPEISICEPALGSHQDVLPAILPFYHVYGLGVMLLAKLAQGVKFVTLPRFEPNSFFKLLDEHQATVLYLAPPLVLLLASHPGVRPKHLQSLRHVMSGAAPLGSLDVERFLRRTPPTTDILQGYGMTEASPLITHGIIGSTDYDSAGVPVPNTEMKVVDAETRTDLPQGEMGEICLRGPQVMKGYLNRPEATAEMIDSEGWLHTGDLGYYDKEGHFYVVDRLKELIKVKGFQVAPAELEEILRSHPDIDDAAVIGVPDERAGEVPRAFVVPKRSQISEEDVKKYVAEKMSEYKQLKGGVEFLASVPKSPSGKILRRMLKGQ